MTTTENTETPKDKQWGRYIFPFVVLSGFGSTVEEAWVDACMQCDPEYIPAPTTYKFEPEDER